MLKPLSKKAIAAALQRAGVSAIQQAEIMQDIDAQRKNAPQPPKKDAEWLALLSQLNADRRVMRGNMSKRSEKMRPIYAAYVEIMDKVQHQIDVAYRLHGLTLKQAQEQAREINAQREAEGKKPLGECGPRWATWVPPHVRQELQMRVDKAYASIGRTRGAKFRPFVSASVNRQLDKSRKLLQGAVKRMRASYEDFPGQGMAYTPYRALWLAAVRMAEIQLHQRLKAYENGTANPVDNPLPVNWMHLLDNTMRSRLLRAKANPADVTLEGLKSFYAPPPENTVADLADQDTAHAAKVKLDFSDEQGYIDPEDTAAASDTAPVQEDTESDAADEDFWQTLNRKHAGSTGQGVNPDGTAQDASEE